MSLQISEACDEVSLSLTVHCWPLRAKSAESMTRRAALCAGRPCRASACCGRCCKTAMRSWAARPWPSASSSAAPPPSCPTGTLSAPSGSRHVAVSVVHASHACLRTPEGGACICGDEASDGRHRVLQGRVRTLALSESSRDDVISSVKDFLHPKAYYQVTHFMSA